MRQFRGVQRAAETCSLYRQSRGRLPGKQEHKYPLRWDFDVGKQIIITIVKKNIHTDEFTAQVITNPRSTEG